MKALLHYKNLLPFLISIVLFLYWVYKTYLFKEFVWDEIVSLTNFVLVDFSTTVTQYPDVNNHIFFNLLNNAYCQWLHIMDLYQAMDESWKIRILVIATSLMSIFYTYLLGLKYFNGFIGNAAAIILVTTIPFLNFTMQLRGYTLSTALFIAVLFHVISFERSGKILQLVLMFFFSTALLYTIPSNVFFVLPIGIFYFLRWFDYSRKLQQEEKRENKNGFVSIWIRSRYSAILLTLGFSAVLAYIFYLPVIEDLLNERHLQQMQGKSFYEYNIADLFPNVLYALSSFRFLFAIPVIIGLFYLIRDLRQYSWTKRNLYHVVFLLFMFFTPFVISFARGDKTPQRSMVPLSTAYSLLLAVAVHSVIREIKALKGKNLISLTIVFAYCLASYFYCVQNIDKVLHKAMLDGEMVFGMFYNFYQSDEYDMEFLDPLIEAAHKTNYPIIMAREIDRVAEGEYLQKHDLKYFSTVWSKTTAAKNDQGFEYACLIEISQGKGEKPQYSRIAFPPSMPAEHGKFIPLFYFLMQNKFIDNRDPHCYVLTFAPRWFEQVMRNGLPQLTYRRLNPRLNYHNIYLVSMP